jgi:glutamate racemase
MAPGVEFVPLACPELVPLIERGAWSGPEAEAVVARSVAGLQDRELDAVILGCTHYPLVAPLLSDALGVPLVNPAHGAVAELVGILATGGLLAPGINMPLHRFLVTGEPAPFAVQADRILPGRVGQVGRVFLETLSLVDGALQGPRASE